MELQQEIAFDNAEDMIGREVLVMIEARWLTRTLMWAVPTGMRPMWTG